MRKLLTGRLLSLAWNVMLSALAIGCLLLALPALADVPVAVPAASPFSGLFSMQGLGGLLTLVAGALGTMKWLSERRKRIVAKVAHYAFLITEDAGNEIDGDDVFDKAAHALKVIDEYMVANGWRPLRPGEVAVAKLELSASHGAEVAKAKVAEAAAVAAVDAQAEARPS